MVGGGSSARAGWIPFCISHSCFGTKYRFQHLTNHSNNYTGMVLPESSWSGPRTSERGILRSGSHSCSTHVHEWPQTRDPTRELCRGCPGTFIPLRSIIFRAQRKMSATLEVPIGQQKWWGGTISPTFYWRMMVLALWVPQLP